MGLVKHVCRSRSLASLGVDGFGQECLWLMVGMDKHSTWLGGIGHECLKEDMNTLLVPGVCKNGRHC